MNVVPLRDTPSLMDLPGCLRQLADQIEAGRTEKIETLIVLTEDESGELGSRCYGVNPTRAHVAGLFFMAAHKTAGEDWSE